MPETPPPRTIWKYDLPFGDHPVVEAPVGAIPRHVGIQDGLLCVWMEVEPDEPTVVHHFRLAGTGHTLILSEGTAYVGTIFDGPFVWHIYHEGEVPHA